MEAYDIYDASVDELRAELKALTLVLRPGVSGISPSGEGNQHALKMMELIREELDAFELYGYDILIDDAFRPWLIEVNASPSLGCANELDDAIKTRLVHDAMRIVDPLGHDREALHEVLQRRSGGGMTSVAQTGGGLYQGTQAESRESLNTDLARVLRGKRQRQFGEMPQEVGVFRRIAPSKRYDSIARFRKKK